MQFDPNVLSLIQLVLIVVSLIAVAIGLACLALTLVLLTRLFKVAGHEQPSPAEVGSTAPKPEVEEVDDGPLGNCSSCGCRFDPSVTKIVEVSASENGSRAVVECQQCGGRTALSTEQARLILPRDS